MTSNKISSRIARRPRAPVDLLIACFEIALKASFAKTSSTPSKSKNLSYCFTSAFFGLVSISIRSFSFKSSTWQTTGSRPTNSGIKPNPSKSSGITFANMSALERSCFFFTSEPNPTPFLPILLSIILSRPLKAPPQINNMLVVSIVMNS